MKENLKTFAFFTAALLTLIPAIYLSRPQTKTFTASQMVNQELFPHLKDVADVSALSISKVGKTGQTSRLEVKKANGQWILTSFSGYPANAQNRMVEVVSALTGLEVLRVIGEDAATRAQCGVLDADESESAEPGEIGTRIVIRNQKDQPILDLILGHEAEEGSGKYYVRRTGQNPVYAVEMDPSKISADFIDWIETDLLKLQPSDITSLFALDCSLDFSAEGQAPAFNYRGQFTITQKYLEDPDWELTSNLRMFGNGMRDMGMPNGQTLDLQRLRRVSQALADMRIASVQRKPAEISKAFLHPENLQIPETQHALLQERGFAVQPMNLGNGTVNQLFSSDGQVHVYSKDGIAYRIFFGGIAGQEDLEDFLKAGERKFYRCMILTAELYPQGLEQPKLQELPSKPDEDADPAAAAQYQMLLEMNQQEQQIYEQKLEDARKKVEKMNTLFADWFFIIPDEMYQQVHLTCGNVFISLEEAQRRQKEADAQKKKTAEEHVEHECTDPNCEHHQHGSHSAEECRDPNCEHHHGSHSAEECTDPNCKLHQKNESETENASVEAPQNPFDVPLKNDSVPETPTGVEAETEALPNPEAENVQKPENPAETEAKLENPSETEAETEALPNPEAENAQKPEKLTETEAKLENPSEAEAETKALPNPEAENVQKPENPAETEAKLENPPEAGTSNTESVPAAKP